MNPFTEAMLKSFMQQFDPELANKKVFPIKRGLETTLETPTFQTFQPEEASTQVVHEIAEKKSASPKFDLALEWLKKHPEDKNLSNRDLGRKLKISHAYIGQAKKVLKGE